jgi:hypothetical protein
MGCANYKDWLSDAALGALDAQRDAVLRAHLAECAACRAALEAERALFAAMDAGLEASVAAEPSPEFVARVRMRLAEEPAPRAAWLTGWLPVTATAMAVIALAAVWFLPRDTVVSPPATPEIGKSSAPAAPATPQQQIQDATNTVRGHVGVVTTGIQRPLRPPQQAPEILVPPGQWLAVVRLYEGVNRGRVDTESLLKPVPLELPAIQELKVPELSIPKIEINGHSGTPEKTEGQKSESGR